MARVLVAALRAALVAIGVAVVARVLMRLVALDSFGRGAFSAAGTAGIVVLFVLSAVGAAVVAALTRRRWVVVVVVVLSSGLLWESDVAIGLSSLDAARAELMTGPRWLGFWVLFAAITALALLTPLLGVRIGRRRGSEERSVDRAHA